MIQNVRWAVALLWIFLLSASLVLAQEDTTGSWPQEIDTPRGVVVIYQPQPEKLDGNKLEARAAVALEPKGSTEPIFGAIWFEARLDTDRAERTATITDVSVTRVRFPEQEKQKYKELETLLEREIPKWRILISMDQLLTSLEMAEKRSEAAERINTDPPKIMFVPEPAVLITIDGEPRLQKEDDSELMQVLNSPFMILLAPSERKYYLYADVDTWYVSNDIQGDWVMVKKVPAEVAARAPKAETDPDEQPGDDEEPGPPPKVIVATEPAELISSRGKPEYTPISGTDLLYMSNTDSDVLMHIEKQQYYVLLAGRWYAAGSLKGPWRYLPGEELPPDFARIPEDAELGTVLYAVPGTDVAKEAVLDAQIPQTAAIDRKKAKLTVAYDGNPKFEKIEGTKMSYAVNTATPVIRVGKTYYACDEAVWFTAENATGSWRVATSVPDEIYTIPPESPIYHVTFVRIYSADPEVVYVGYTPGYTNTYVYHTTIVYGTGYYYPGWYGRWYYPRPSTWGFHVRWNPWTGWGFGLSYGSGPFRFTIGFGGWYRGGWWGPGRYSGYRRGYRHGYRRGTRAGYRAGYRSGRRNAAQKNIYGSNRNQARAKASHATGGKQARAGAAKKRANNVYTDRNGNVHRKTDQGWQSRSKDGWESRKDQPQTQRQQTQRQQGQRSEAQRQQGQRSEAQRPQTQQTQRQQAQRPQTQQKQQTGVSSGSRTDTKQLDRSSKARQRGDQRSKSYNSARKRPSSSGRSGGRSGGRGRRR